MFNITPIIQCVICVLFILGSAYGVPFLKAKLGAAKMTELQGYINIAVKAAEQLFAGSGRGAEKKSYVLAWLNDRGITVDPDKIDAMIESVVYELTQDAKYTEAVASTGIVMNGYYGETDGGTEDSFDTECTADAKEPAEDEEEEDPGE